MTKLYETLQQQRACVLDIAHQYHAANIRVFGSVVRGEEREDSDIDISRFSVWNNAIGSGWPD